MSIRVPRAHDPVPLRSAGPMGFDVFPDDPTENVTGAIPDPTLFTPQMVRPLARGRYRWNGEAPRSGQAN